MFSVISSQTTTNNNDCNSKDGQGQLPALMLGAIVVYYKIENASTDKISSHHLSFYPPSKTKRVANN
jgi:hypothetical protein